MKIVLLDLHDVYDRDTLYDKITEAFGFPDYFGRNLDALYDCLTDICADTCVGLLLPARPAVGDEMPGQEFTLYLSKLRQTFTDAEAENPHLCVARLDDAVAKLNTTEKALAEAQAEIERLRTELNQN